MSYIGLNPQQQLLNTSTQFFSGDGSTVQFTLSRSVASASDLDVLIGTTPQKPTVDYSAQNITLLFASAPASGTNNITVTFRAGALNSLDLTADAFGAGTVGAPSVYSVAANNTGLYWPNATTMAVTIAGSNRAVFSSNVQSTSNTTGALTVAGGVGITGNINTSGLVVLTNTTNSSNIDSGALTVAGGAGIVGNLNVGGDITCVGDFTVNGTFTTTGTDSLEVNDPFIFLANANPGDSFDTGVIAQYYDTANRYTGYFRDITDGRVKFFGNLLTRPTTVVDTSDPSFTYSSVVVGTLSATGNITGAYLIGNGSQLTGISTDTTQIYNANSRVIISSANGNIVNNVNGVTIATVSSTGIAVTGLLSASSNISAAGNVLAGNVSAAGIVTATGNIVSSDYVSGGNLITGGTVSATGNITGGNLRTGGQVSAGGNIVGGNIRTAGLMSATGDVYGNNFSATTAINATGNITGGNLITGGLVSATGSIAAGTTISAVGNITGGNVNTGILSLSGNVITPINTTSAITTTANINGANIIASALLQGATLSATGAVTFSGTTTGISIGTSQTTGTAVIGGTAQTGAINIGRSTGTQTLALANGVTASGNAKTISVGENGAAGSTTTIAVGPTAGAGTVTFNTGTTVTIANTSGSALSVAGNVTAGNIKTTDITITSNSIAGVTTISASGNITGGNLITGGLITASGTITGGNLATGGTATVTGNITGGNVITNGLVTAGGSVNATGNITGGNIATGGLITATGNITATANVAGGNVISSALIRGVTLSATGNVIGANVQSGTLSLSGNVISAIVATSSISAVGNITGGNLITAATVTGATGTFTTVNGNGRALTSLNATNIDTGTLAQARLANASLTVNGVSIALGGSGTVTANTTNTLTLGSYLTGTSFNGGTAVTAAVDAATAATASKVVARDGSGNFAANAVTVTSLLNGGSNGVGNIGSSTTYFNTVFAKATSAQYADLAEAYVSDQAYAPGTVVVFGGDQEVTESAVNGDTRVAGVVSTNPAYVMNSTLTAEHVVVVGLVGRVPTRVFGPVVKGDLLVSAERGHARASAAPQAGTIIGKALENFNGESGTIEVVVGRM